MSLFSERIIFTVQPLLSIQISEQTLSQNPIPVTDRDKTSSNIPSVNLPVENKANSSQTISENDLFIFTYENGDDTKNDVSGNSST